MRTSALLLTFAFSSFSATAFAQLTLRQSQVVEGAYSTIGNLLIDCPGAGTCDNNSAVMDVVDVDQVTTTTMSSSATLELPVGAVVRTAILYVSASGTERVDGAMPGAWVPQDVAAFAAELAGPRLGYVPIVPADVAVNATRNAYLARFDVTPLVTGSGEYFVADALMIPATHPYNRILSWVLFVTFDDGSPPRLINLYDGSLNCFMNSTTINLAGFRTPAAVSPTALFTAWSVDGHPTLAGESITVGTLVVSNPSNPANNIGNATVSSPAGPIPRNPSTFRVTEEMDLDTFNVSSAFTTSQTSIDIVFTCGNLEGVVYQMAVLGVDVIAPDINVEKTVIDLNGGDAVAGDELEYELRVETIGGDDAVDVVLRDVLPSGLSYVAQSIEYVAPIAATKTDQAGDDEAEFTGSELVFRLGTGANSTRGGTIAVGAEQLVRFRARIETATTARSIVNQAIVSARGAQGGSGATEINVLSSSVAVDALPCAGFENGMCPDAGTSADAEAPDAFAADAPGLADAEPRDMGALQDARPSDDAAATDARPSGSDAGVSLDAGTTIDEDDGDGCGCHVTERRNVVGDIVLLVVLLVFAGVRRRTRAITR